MPIYSFQCNDCQTEFDIRASFQEKELGLKPVCPKCQSIETKQVLSAGLFLRSGSSGESFQPSSVCSPNSGSGCCG